MRRLFLMCGLAFTGKTTLAKALVERTNAAYISLDEINAERGLWGGAGIPVEEWERTHQIALRRMDELMPYGREVVLDDTNNLRWLRDRFRATAGRHGYQARVIYLDIPLPELRQRMQRNQTTHERAAVRTDIVEELVGDFEQPTVDEDVLRFTVQEPVETWLQAHFPDES